MFLLVVLTAVVALVLGGSKADPAVRRARARAQARSIYAGRATAGRR